MPPTMRKVLGPSLLVLVTLVFAWGCTGRPTEEECKKAIANVQKVYKYDAVSREAETMAFVRKCRARSSRDNVACLINATNDSEIVACNKK